MRKTVTEPTIRDIDVMEGVTGTVYQGGGSWHWHLVLGRGDPKPTTFGSWVRPENGQTPWWTSGRAESRDSAERGLAAMAGRVYAWRLIRLRFIEGERHYEFGAPR